MVLLTISEYKAMKEGVGIHVYELTLQQVWKQGEVGIYSILQTMLLFS